MQRAKLTVDRLISLQHPISNDELVDATMDGLNGAMSPYRDFCRSLEARMTAISYDDLFGLLLTEERQLRKDKSPVMSQPIFLEHKILLLEAMDMVDTHNIPTAVKTTLLNAMVVTGIVEASSNLAGNLMGWEFCPTRQLTSQVLRHLRKFQL